MINPTFSEAGRVALSKLLVGVNALCFVVGFMFCRIGLKIRPIITDFMKLFQDHFFDYLTILLLVCGCTLIVGSIVCIYFYLCAIVVNQRTKFYLVYFGLRVYMILQSILIVVVVGLVMNHRNSISESIRTGMIEAMKLYKSNPDFKQSIDRVQIEYSCCGSDKYSDWFQVPWVSDEFVDTQLTEVKEHLKSGVYLADDVPFSCCDPMAPRPCINRHVHDNDVHPSYDFLNDVTLYKTGCKLALEVFVEVKIFYPLIIAFITFLIFYQLNFVLASFLDTSITLAIRSGNPKATTIAYCSACCSNLPRVSTAVAACPTPSSVKAESCNPFYRPSPFALGQSGAPFDMMNRGRNAGSSRLWHVVENESSSGFSNLDIESLKTSEKTNARTIKAALQYANASKHNKNKNKENSENFSRYRLEDSESNESQSKASKDAVSSNSKFSSHFVKSQYKALVKKVSQLSLRIKRGRGGSSRKQDNSDEYKKLIKNVNSEDEDENENVNNFANYSDSENDLHVLPRDIKTTSRNSVEFVKKGKSQVQESSTVESNINACNSNVSQAKSELVGEVKKSIQMMLNSDIEPVFPSDGDSNEVKSMPKLKGNY